MRREPVLSKRGNRRPLPSVVFAIAACLLWSSGFVFVKKGLDYQGPLTFAGFRFFLAGIVLLPFSGSPGTQFRAYRRHGGFIALIALFQLFNYGLVYLGVARVHASTAAIIVGSVPLMTALLAHFFLPGERLDGAKTLSLAVGFAGLVLLSVSRAGAGAVAGTLGKGIWIFIMVFGVLCASVSLVVISGSKRDFPAMVLTSGQMTLSGAVLILLGRFLEGPIETSFPTVYWVSLFWLAIISAGAFSIWFWLLRVRKAPASAISVWLFLIPIVGAAGSWIFLPQDKPDLGSLTGVFLISGAVAAYSWPRGKTGK